MFFIYCLEKNLGRVNISQPVDFHIHYPSRLVENFQLLQTCINYKRQHCENFWKKEWCLNMGFEPRFFSLTVWGWLFWIWVESMETFMIQTSCTVFVCNLNWTVDTNHSGFNLSFKSYLNKLKLLSASEALQCFVSSVINQHCPVAVHYKTSLAWP